MMRSVIVLIPAFNPDEKLIALVHQLKASFGSIVLVNDGSTTGQEIFDTLHGIVDAVLVHSENRGKGAALKTGFAHILATYPSCAGVVTADADGQHAVHDILLIARSIEENPETLTLGVRSFEGGVPFRSRFGNFWTRWFFFLVTGLKIQDTQTGLRGIPVSLLPRMLTLEGDRYEYEMQMLADAKNYAVEPVQITIDTIYLDANATSHFNPLIDSIKIYWSLLHFCVSSVFSFVIDNAVFLLACWAYTRHVDQKAVADALSTDVWTFTQASARIAVGMVVARLVSANFNFFYNRFCVFHSASTKRSFFQYWGLVIVIGVAAYSGTVALTNLAGRGVPVVFIKILVETLLFLASYKLQKHWIFRKKKMD